MSSKNIGVLGCCDTIDRDCLSKVALIVSYQCRLISFSLSKTKKARLSNVCIFESIFLLNTNVCIFESILLLNIMLDFSKSVSG